MKAELQFSDTKNKINLKTVEFMKLNMKSLVETGLEFEFKAVKVAKKKEADYPRLVIGSKKISGFSDIKKTLESYIKRREAKVQVEVAPRIPDVSDDYDSFLKKEAAVPKGQTPNDDEIPEHDRRERELSEGLTRMIKNRELHGMEGSQQTPGKKPEIRTQASGIAPEASERANNLSLDPDEAPRRIVAGSRNPSEMSDDDLLASKFENNGEY